MIDQKTFFGVVFLAVQVLYLFESIIRRPYIIPRHYKSRRKRQFTADDMSAQQRRDVMTPPTREPIFSGKSLSNLAGQTLENIAALCPTVYTNVVDALIGVFDQSCSDIPTHTTPSLRFSPLWGQGEVILLVLIFVRMFSSKCGFV